MMSLHKVFAVLTFLVGLVQPVEGQQANPIPFRTPADTVWSIGNHFIATGAMSSEEMAIRLGSERLLDEPAVRDEGAQAGGGTLIVRGAKTGAVLGAIAYPLWYFNQDVEFPMSIPVVFAVGAGAGAFLGAVTGTLITIVTR